jgi:glutathione peroxidase
MVQNMTVRQRILKLVYPLFTLYKQKKGHAKTLRNTHDILPHLPFHSLDVTLTNGSQLLLEKLRGKKVLIVNTASDCGYTRQYEELQKLYERLKEGLEIIAFPTNEFREQEKGSDEEISRFCSVNYNIKFPLAKKSHVLKVPEQNSVFRWLTHKEENGWNNKLPAWNFSKYLIDEKGVLTHYFDPAISPLSRDVLDALNE